MFRTSVSAILLCTAISSNSAQGVLSPNFFSESDLPCSKFISDIFLTSNEPVSAYSAYIYSFDIPLKVEQTAYDFAVVEDAEETETVEVSAEVTKTEEPEEFQETEIKELPVTEAVAETTAVISEEEPEIYNFISNGIDVSYWQGFIDFERVKAAGIDFVMIKAGESTELDPSFRENIKNAKAAGLNCGVYWFTRATNVDEAVAEAEVCINAVKDYTLEYPVVFDCEGDKYKNYSKPVLTNIALAFLKKIEDSGYYSMLYTNTSFSSEHFYLEEIQKDYDIWYAGYHIEKPRMECGIWQKANDGVVDGINANNDRDYESLVDLNVSYKNYPAIMKKYNINGF